MLELTRMDQYRNRQESKRRATLLIIGIVLMIALVGMVLHLIEKHGELDVQFGDTGGWGDDDSEPIELLLNDIDYISDDKVQTYLIAGTDAGGDDLGEGFNGELADFVTVMVIDDTTEKYAFYQLDRNTMCNVPILVNDGVVEQYAYEQLCLAHWYGLNAEERNQNLMEATSMSLGGLGISGYYVLSMKDIGAVNDAIGGVTVDIDTDMTNLDPAFTEGATVHLDGKQAESFLRARMDVGGGTNKERMSRQNQYMQKAYAMVTGQLRENPDYINDLYDQLDSKVESDGTPKRISTIADKLMRYDNMGIIQFDGEVKTGDTIGEGKEHEEFYVDEGSILANFRKVMNIREYTEADEEAEDEDE